MTQAGALGVAGVVGACIGSFLNVVIWRLPRGESVAKGRSHCPKCGKMIRARDNVPVLSWLMLRARCRDCKAPISARYPFVEALTAALFVLAAWRHPFPEETALAAVKCAVLSALVCVSFIDVDRREIPDAITKPGVVLGLLLSLLLPALHTPHFLGLPNPHLASLFESVAGAATGALVLLGVRVLGHLVMGKEAMGLGDVKLLAMVGAFVRPLDVLLTLLVASVGGALLGGVYVVLRARRPAELSGTIALDGREPVKFSAAYVRAPRRKPITVGVVLDAASAAGLSSGAKAAIEIVLPGKAVWSDDGQDVPLSIKGVVERVEPTRTREHASVVVVRPEPLDEIDGEWLETFALQRVSIPFGVFLSIGAAAILLFGAEIQRFVVETWPRLIIPRS